MACIRKTRPDQDGAAHPPRTALAAWNDADTGWTVADGQYQLSVGDSSRTLPLTTGIHS
jgi:hypothetical protein